VAPSYRQASRVANTMYVARACRTLADAREATAFLLCDATRAHLTIELFPDWTGRIVLLALPEPEAVAARFRKRGAAVALITVFDEITPCRFFVEGDAEAAANARKLLESAQADVVITAEGSRPHLEAARLLAGPILMGLLEAASLHLRRTDVPLEALRELTAKLAGQTLRVHRRSGARTWRATDGGHLASLLATLRQIEPALADFLHASESASHALLRED
jgi:hypothetical protein